MILGDYIKTSSYTYVAGFVLLALSHGYAYHKGNAHGIERYYDLKSAVEQAQKQAEANAAHERAERERVTREVVDGWAAAVDYLRAHPRIVRVRECAAGGSCEVSAVPGASGKPDAAAAEFESSAGINEAIFFTPAECEVIANRAVMDAAQLLWLQHWIREQQYVGMER